MVEAYLQQLSPLELVALDVARRTFASFDLKRTIGYLEFLKKNPTP